MGHSATERRADHLRRRIRVARGEEPGDLLLTGGRVLNVFTGEIGPGDVVVADGRIVGVGPYAWSAPETMDLEGQIVLPGLIDAHMHLESTLLTPAELARVVVPHGTTTIIADPHEIANVLGVPGIEMLLEASEGLPLDIFYMAPSCVPAAPFEHAGAVLDAEAVAQVLRHQRVLGLAEMMNFPGVLAGDDDVVKKLVCAAEAELTIDGHAPGLSGRDLVAYVAAGIRSDHESTTPEEALAKARLGMLVQVREGSSAKNLDSLLPLIRAGKLGRWCLCTDDVHPDDLLEQGHLDARLRRVIAAGVSAAEAVRHVSLVPAEHYGLDDRGAIAPGYRADLIVVDDLDRLNVTSVLKDGLVVARDGQYRATPAAKPVPEQNSVRIAELSERDFQLRLSADEALVIEVVPEQIVTRKQTIRVCRRDGVWQFDPDQDVLLVASIERHQATGQVGLGLVTGFALKRGALGSSVAHDSHNLILVGTSPGDMVCCARQLHRMGGGFVVTADGRTLAQLPLPIAGLLSPEPAGVLAGQLDQLHRAARSLGCTLPAPFGTLSFLALSVIPELRITDQGLFDVGRQQFVAPG